MKLVWGEFQIAKGHKRWLVDTRKNFLHLLDRGLQLDHQRKLKIEFLVFFILKRVYAVRHLVENVLALQHLLEVVPGHLHEVIRRI